MNKLILTGWGWVGYATAAAVAQRKLKKADIRGMSARRLPEHLMLLADSNCRYEQIIILGVPLTNKSEKLITALKKLKACQIEVTWLSILDLPKRLPQSIGELLHIHIGQEHNQITEFVANYYQQPCDDLLAIRNVAFDAVGASAENLARYQLIQAAQYRYRNYQDNNSYIQAINTLANRDKLNAEQKEMIKHFQRYGQRELKGRSKVMQRLHELINKIGPKDSARVLIHGPSGTGKETVAIQLHEKSSRRKKPFVTFNCASSSTNLLESLLFGYVKGAFTGANKDNKGVFEKADGGTLFLDEVGELSLEIQANILRVLQEGYFNRLGSVEEIRIDVRIIAATNRDLTAMVKAGTFREDLFYRLNVIPIYLLPLRQHPEDIADIANNFWYRWHSKKLSIKQLKVLESYDWPGNARELGNFLEYASVMEENDFTTLLNEHRRLMRPMATTEVAVPENLEALIRQHAAKIFERYDRNISRTATVLGITRNTLKKYLSV